MSRQGDDPDRRGVYLMGLIYTIKGDLDESLLDRTIVETDNPNDVGIGLEWRLKDTGELVRRDAWVVMKRLSEPLTGSAGTVG